MRTTLFRVIMSAPVLAMCAFILGCGGEMQAPKRPGEQVKSPANATPKPGVTPQPGQVSPTDTDRQAEAARLAEAKNEPRPSASPGQTKGRGRRRPSLGKTPG